jgi:hypothetical protein
MESTRPNDHDRPDLIQPDEGRTLVWSRKGRIRVAILGSAVVLAAGAAAGYRVSADPNSAGADGSPAQVYEK